MAQSEGSVIAIVVVFMVLPVLFLALRATARLSKQSSFSPDDWLAFVSYITFVLCIVAPALVMAVQLHLGNHSMPGPNGMPLPPSYKWNITLLMAQTLNYIPLTLIKLSILFFYRRIFRGRGFNAISWTVIVMCIAWGIAFFFATLFSCTPVGLALSAPPTDPQVHCFNKGPLIQAATITDLLMDVIIIAIPFPFVWSLQMSRSDKIGVSLTFLLGACTIGASLARVIGFIAPLHDLARHDPDFTYYVAPAEYILTIEVSLAIISACLPTLRPLVKGKSIGSFINSLRSMVSLGSGSRSAMSTNDEKSYDKSKLTSTTSSIHSHPRDGREYTCKTDVAIQHGRVVQVDSTNGQIAPNGIVVSREFAVEREPGSAV